MSVLPDRAHQLRVAGSSGTPRVVLRVDAIPHGVYMLMALEPGLPGVVREPWE